jgi:hypothetical protein
MVLGLAPWRSLALNGRVLRLQHQEVTQHLREAYRRANSALQTIERAKKEHSADLREAFLLQAMRHAKESQAAIEAAARLLRANEERDAKPVKGSIQR